MNTIVSIIRSNYKNEVNTDSPSDRKLITEKIIDEIREDQILENSDGLNNDLVLLRKWLELNEKTIMDHIDDNNALRFGTATQ